MDKQIRISERAVLQRVRRALRKDGDILMRAPARYRSDGTEWFIVRDNIINTTVYDLEALAREMGVLAPHETLDD